MPCVNLISRRGTAPVTWSSGQWHQGSDCPLVLGSGEGTPQILLQFWAPHYKDIVGLECVQRRDGDGEGSGAPR